MMCKNEHRAEAPPRTRCKNVELGYPRQRETLARGSTVKEIPATVALSETVPPQSGQIINAIMNASYDGLREDASYRPVIECGTIPASFRFRYATRAIRLQSVQVQHAQPLMGRRRRHLA